MNYNKKGQKGHLRIAIVILLGVSLTVGIILLKTKSRSVPEETAPGIGAGDAPAQVAVPDTTTESGSLPATPDTVAASVLPDTLIGRDERSPYEAGYEDGYAAGCDDGADGAEEASYDDSSSFSSAAERATYAKGYKEGYAQGYEDGREGEQFNITAGH